MKRKIKSFLCLIFGHRYAEIIRLSDYTHLIGCVRCKRRWGMNTDVQALIPWDMELEDVHRVMGHFENPRSGR